MNDSVYYVWLSLVCGQGSRLPMLLLRKYSSAKNVFEADIEGIKEVAGEAFNRIVARIAEHDLAKAKEICDWCEQRKVNVITPESKEYPKALLLLRDAPMVLYTFGKLPDMSKVLTVSVVGTRKMSDYGKKVAYEIGYGLAKGGACVVSGMALGIDGMAMAGAIEAKGKTVAVLGCGIDIIYPFEHKELMKNTAKNGAVITEYPPGTPPVGAHFPVRNRIISGMCQATVVVEADMKSGSLITARHAIYQGRDVYAVPGKVGESNSEGTLYLIKSGAGLVTSAGDIIRNYEFMYPDTLKIARSPQDKPTAEEAAAKNSIFARDNKKYYGVGVYGGKSSGKTANKANAEERQMPKTKPIEAAKVQNTPQPTKAKEKSAVVNKHIELDMLGDKEIKIYRAMTPDVPMLPDEISRLGFPLPEVMSAMTMLEISGVVEIGSGGYYLRRSSDGDFSDGRFGDGIGD